MELSPAIGARDDNINALSVRFIHETVPIGSFFSNDKRTVSLLYIW